MYHGLSLIDTVLPLCTETFKSWYHMEISESSTGFQMRVDKALKEYQRVASASICSALPSVLPTSLLYSRAGNNLFESIIIEFTSSSIRILGSFTCKNH